MPGPPGHVHPYSEESFAVIEGSLDICRDGAWSSVQAGETAVVPAGVPHTLRNASDEPVKTVTRIQPAGRSEAFFRDMHRLIQEGKIKRLPPKEPRSAIYAAMLFSNYPDEIRATGPLNGVFKAARLLPGEGFGSGSRSLMLSGRANDISGGILMSVDASEAQAIDRTRETHVDALNRGDGGGWAAAFADDAVQMPPNAPANVGKDQIRAFCGAMLGAFGAEFSLAPEEVQIAGPDCGVERGTYNITLTPKGGGEPIPRRWEIHNSLPAAARWQLGNGPRHLEQQQPATRHDRIDGSAGRFVVLPELSETLLMPVVVGLPRPVRAAAVEVRAAWDAYHRELARYREAQAEARRVLDHDRAVGRGQSSTRRPSPARSRWPTSISCSAKPRQTCARASTARPKRSATTTAPPSPLRPAESRSTPKTIRQLADKLAELFDRLEPDRVLLHSLTNFTGDTLSSFFRSHLASAPDQLLRENRHSVTVSAWRWATFHSPPSRRYTWVARKV